jgi:hypothetical protein
MDDRDLEALERAVKQAKKISPGQIERKLETEDWLSVAKFAAFSCQIDSLKLFPHQMPPCELDLAHINNIAPDDKIWSGAARMLKKMLAADLSRYEPDPLAALARMNLGVIYGGTA